MKRMIIATAVLISTLVHADLIVKVGAPKAMGEKAVVNVELVNTFSQKIETARAACFMMDEHGKMAGNATRWVIGKAAPSASDAGLAPGATNRFYFVIPLNTRHAPGTTASTEKSLTPKLVFSRVVMEGGKLADIKHDVKIENTDK